MYAVLKMCSISVYKGITAPFASVLLLPTLENPAYGITHVFFPLVIDISKKNLKYIYLVYH